MINLRKCAFLPVLMLVAGCQAVTAPPRPAVDIVNRIAADKDGRYHHMLSSYAAPDKDGSIAIIGTASQCDTLMSLFSACDRHDNVDGKPYADGLPDFAGEQIAAYADVSSSESDALRDFVVRASLAAVDSIYSITQYDIESQGRKSPAKLIVLADPGYNIYGKFDIDTLMQITGCGIRTITPMGAAFDELFSGAAEVSSIGIITGKEWAGKGLYPEIISQEFSSRNLSGTEAVVFAVRDSSDALVDYLDKYEASGHDGRLDAIIVDDINVNVDEMNATLGRITSVTSQESVTYGKLISPDLRIISTKDALMNACYLMLRSQNTFTHNISYPETVSFYSVKNPAEGQDGYLFIRNLAHVQY